MTLCVALYSVFHETEAYKQWKASFHFVEYTVMCRCIETLIRCIQINLLCYGASLKQAGLKGSLTRLQLSQRQ